MNITRVFIDEALKALRDADLTEEQEEELCDVLVDLCMKYAPGTFIDHSNEEDSPQDPAIEDIQRLTKEIEEKEKEIIGR